MGYNEYLRDFDYDFDEREYELKQIKRVYIDNNKDTNRYFFRATYNGVSTQIEIDKEFYKEKGREKMELHLKPILYHKLKKIVPGGILNRNDIKYKYFNNSKYISYKILLK